MSDLTISSPFVRVSTPATAAASPAPVARVGATRKSVSPVAEAEAKIPLRSKGEAVVPQKASLSSSAPAATANILTFRDNDTGRLIIKLVDKDNNSIITEFPSQSMLSNYPKINTNPVQIRTVDEKI
ncbi:flagellar protein FlaG [Kiloniella laminariae]|uniref:Flagellar protein FlaG n=1 Tax=Kiloniella laminariae TaxID=454162 RepID=A0ABT4LHE0_9PROT|nr:flagellar protein FlaG [Kiloniella laminariae]MCZ4280513.1 flagellar protein FlaG [Kiloniella laminariae]